MSAAFADVYRDGKMSDVLVMLLLFFLGKNFHNELCVWLVRMGKWNAIDGRGFECMYI